MQVGVGYVREDVYHELLNKQETMFVHGFAFIF